MLVFWQVLKDELEASQLWIEKHISDHSGYHYRQNLVRQLLSSYCTRSVTSQSSCDLSETSNLFCDGSVMMNVISPAESETDMNSADNHTLDESLGMAASEFLQKELEFASDIIVTFPGHESAWCHRYSFYLASNYQL